MAETSDERKARASERFWDTGSDEAWTQVQRDLERPARCFPTGLPTLDQACGRGIPEAKLVTLAGVDSSGKSVLALHMAFHAADRGDTVAVLSLDMDGRDWLHRMLTTVSGMTTRDMLAQEQLDTLVSERLAFAMDKIQDFPGRVLVTRDQKPTLDEALLAISDAAVLGARMVVVDFVQVLRAHGKQGWRENRTVELEDAVRALRDAAKEYQVVVVAISQMSRRAKEADKPHMHHAMGGSAFEYYADLNLVLDHTTIPPECPEDKPRFIVRIEKNRITGCSWSFWVELDRPRQELKDLGRVFSAPASAKGSKKKAKRDDA